MFSTQRFTSITDAKQPSIQLKSVVSTIVNENQDVFIQKIKAKSGTLQPALKKEDSREVKNHLSQVLREVVTDIMEFVDDRDTKEIHSKSNLKVSTSNLEYLGVDDHDGFPVDLNKDNILVALLEALLPLVALVLDIWIIDLEDEDLLEGLKSVLDDLLERYGGSYGGSGSLSWSHDTSDDYFDDETRCLPYAEVDDVAANAVCSVLDDATDRAGLRLQFIEPPKIRSRSLVEIDRQLSAKLGSSEIQPYREYYDIEWPKICDFNNELGADKIYEYLTTFKHYENWTYCVNYKKCQSDEVNDYYYYQALWSIPLIDYPIPQVTASVYFTIRVSRVIPSSCLVDVSYVFEGTSFVHKPGLTEFQESWLFNVIDSKISIFKQVTF